jgi:lipoprotein-releasing system ATP-binding protein
VKGIDLEVRKGETIAILGVSGVGKTTLLHILGALDRPTRGRVLYRGEDQFTRLDRDLARFRNREIGFVFQFHYLLSDLSALENTMLPALIAGMARKQAERKAAGLLEELGLAERMTHRPGKLSGGEQQRVAVARAVIMDPQIVLADEPTGNLDTQSAGVVEDLLVRLRDTRGISVVAVTHNPGFAARMDRQIHMVDGRLEEAEKAEAQLNPNGPQANQA